MSGYEHCWGLCLRTGGGRGWHKASVSDCLPLAARIGLSQLLILTLCGPKRVLVVSPGGGGGLACRLWCIVLICSWRRLLAYRHSLPFPWSLSLHRRWCPSACPHPVSFLILLVLSMYLCTGGGGGAGTTHALMTPLPQTKVPVHRPYTLCSSGPMAGPQLFSGGDRGETYGLHLGSWGHKKSYVP